MTGAVGRRRREKGSPRRFPLIFSRSPPIPDAGLPSFFDASDRLDIHVQVHRGHFAGLRMLCVSASHACSRSWLSRFCGPQLSVIAFVACAMPLQLGIASGMLCATKPYARARHRTATFSPRLVRGPPPSLSTSRGDCYTGTTSAAL